MTKQLQYQLKNDLWRERQWIKALAGDNQVNITKSPMYTPGATRRQVLNRHRQGEACIIDRLEGRL